MRTSKLLNWMICAMMAAVTAALSQFVIPIGLVPINMATLAVMISGGLLGARHGALSQIIYVLMGAIGLPVFAYFAAGPGIITGPTGGYIIGYVAMAWLTGFAADHGGRKTLPLALGMVAGTVVLYTLGTAWFMFSMEMGLVQSLASCVFPFLPMDAVKIMVGTMLVIRLHRALPAAVVGAS